jgi:hypothetical protein
MAIDKIFYPAAIEAAGSVGRAGMTRPAFRSGDLKTSECLIGLFFA